MRALWRIMRQHGLPSHRPDFASLTRNTQKILYWIHVIGGLTAGSVLTVAALTGALLLFKPELDEVLNSGLLTVRPGAATRPVDALLATARSVLPDDRPTLIRILDQPDATVSVMFASREIIYLDPSTGAVSGQRNYFSGLFGRTEQIHRYLLMGDTGRLLTGGAALVYVILFSSGLLLSVRLRSWFRFDTRLRGRARLINLHKVGGACLGGIVLLSAVSSLPHAFGWVKQGLYAATGEKPTAVPTVTEGSGAQRPDLLAHALAVIDGMSPGPRTVYFQLPASARTPLTAFYIAADASHAHARSYVWFDPATGAVLRATPHAESLRGDRLYFASLSLHFGQFAGLGGRLLMLSGCAGLLLLVVTGLLAFFRKQKRSVVFVQSGVASAVTRPENTISGPRTFRHL